MKKFLKVLGLSLGSLVLLVLIAVGVVLWLVFTPAKITRLANRYAADFVTCPYQIGRIEPTFFSTFPQFGLRIDEVSLGRTESDPAWLSLHTLTAKVDLMALLKKESLSVNEVSADGLFLKARIDADGHANWEVFRTSETESDRPADTAAVSLPFGLISLDKLQLSNLTVDYADETSGLAGRVDQLQLEAALKLADGRAEGHLGLDAASVSASRHDTCWLNQLALSLSLPFQLNLETMDVALSPLSVRLNELPVVAEGSVCLGDSVAMDLKFSLGERTSLDELLALVPEAYASMLDGIQADGRLSVQGRAVGQLSENTLPAVDLQVELDQLQLSLAQESAEPIQAAGNLALSVDLKTTPQALQTLDFAQIDLQADLRLEQLKARMEGLDVSSPHTQLSLQVDRYPQLALDMHRMQLLLSSAESSDMSVCGSLQANARLQSSLESVQALDFDHLKLGLEARMKGLQVNSDSLRVAMPSLNLALGINRPLQPKNIHIAVNGCPSLQLAMGDLAADLRQPALELDLSNPSDLLSGDDLSIAEISTSDQDGIVISLSDKLPEVAMRLSVGQLSATQGATQVAMTCPAVELALSDHATAAQTLAFSLGGQQLQFAMDNNRLSSSALELSAMADCPQRISVKNALVELNPRLAVSLDNVRAGLDGFADPIAVPTLSVAYDNHLCRINEASVCLGQTDFHLDGDVRNLVDFLDGDSLLAGELNFESNHCDVNYLLSLVSGLGNDSTELDLEEPALEPEPAQASEPNPFIVPKGIDVVLHTRIRETEFAGQHVSNLGGNVYVRDGVMILEEMGFICDAAKLSLTAMYKSPRPNHLYVGLDYHMVDIRIDEIVSMIPQVDSVLPMLRSFKGNGEFHVAAETYLTADYRLKPSTLRGALSITGKDLVLLDGEQFTEISKVLMFNKQTENKIDSINAEMTLFRKEVDIYPLQVTMDKYKAIVSGRHNLDMSFDYHISLVSPLKLGVNIGGKLGDLKIVPTAPKYTDQYHPSRRHVVEQQQLELRNLVREQLRKQL